MRDAPRYLGRAGDQVVRGRVAQYRRYAALTAEQEVALATEDVERFEHLAEELAEVRAEIGAIDGPDDVLSDQGAREEAAKALTEAMATNRRIQDRLASLKRDNATLVKRLNRRAPEARRYLEDGDGAPTSHLDVKL